MSLLSSALLLSLNPRVQLSPGSSLKPVDQFMGSVSAMNLPNCPSCTGNLQLSTSRRPFLIKARDGGRPDSASIFVGDYVLGGATVSALGLEGSLFSSSKREAQVSSHMLRKALVGEHEETEDEEPEIEDLETEYEDEETEDDDEETEEEEQEIELDEEQLEKRKMVANMIADINSALDTVVERIHSDLGYDPNEVYLDLDKEEYGTFVGPDEYQTII